MKRNSLSLANWVKEVVRSSISNVCVINVSVIVVIITTVNSIIIIIIIIIRSNIFIYY